VTQSSYPAALSASIIQAARAAVGEELGRHLSVVREPPAEIRQLIARLVALDSVKRRAARRRVVAASPLQPRLPGATPLRG
jgi:hypothetical protein